MCKRVNVIFYFYFLFFAYIALYYPKTVSGRGERYFRYIDVSIYRDLCAQDTIPDTKLPESLRIQYTQKP